MESFFGFSFSQNYVWTYVSKFNLFEILNVEYPEPSKSSKKCKCFTYWEQINFSYTLPWNKKKNYSASGKKRKKKQTKIAFQLSVGKKIFWKIVLALFGLESLHVLHFPFEKYWSFWNGWKFFSFLLLWVFSRIYYIFFHFSKHTERKIKPFIHIFRIAYFEWFLVYTNISIFWAG